MIDTRTRRILRIISRDLETVIAPELASPRAKFLIGAMKGLLQTAMESPSVSDGLGRGADLGSLIRGAVAAHPGAAGARDEAYRQSGSGLSREARDGKGVIGPITVEPLLAYLRQRGDSYDWVNSAGLKQAPGGFSKETYLVTLSGSERIAELVLRRDPIFSPLGSTVVDEFPLLSALATLPLPLPQMLWCEPDAKPFGAAVVAMKRLPGGADVAQWSSAPERAVPVINQAASLLARLHSPDVLATYEPRAVIPGANGGTPAAMIADLFRFWRSLAFTDDFLVEAVFEWLRDNAPQSFVRRALLHGDFGFHNLLVEEDRITGLLDWEFCHSGDIAEDLAYARPFIEQVVPWAEFDSLYRQYGGAEVDEDTLRFYGVFGLLRIGLGCYATLREIDSGNDGLDSKAAYVATNFARPFVIDAAKLAAGMA